jgi:hypothetical protein
MPSKFIVEGDIEFGLKFSADGAILNTLVIKLEDRVIATDANVADESYTLPSESYVASVRFHGPSGTIGKLTIDTTTGQRSRSAKIREGSVRETVSLGFDL